MLDKKKFKDSKILITGGVGSFGNAFISKFYDFFKEIRVFSRDEKKQEDMRKIYNNNKIKFYLGDVRDRESIYSATKDIDYIFHAAALKQVPSCDFFPVEATKTNILGTENVLNAAILSGVKRVICLSTDKAVYPINAMGISKAMAEKVMSATSRSSQNTIISCTRYGNVMASRGSVIPLFINQIINNQPITLTNPNMTRFMMTLDEAVDLVLYAFNHSSSGDIFVQKSPAATIEDLVKALLIIFDKPKHKVNIIGPRHGEKLHETLISAEEMQKVNDLGKYYKISPDLRDLNYSNYIDSGDINNSLVDNYDSSNTQKLNIEELVLLLNSLDYVTKLKP